MARQTFPTRSLDPSTLKASAALLAAQTALSRVIDDEAVRPTGFDPTIVDLLTRLDQAPARHLRSVELSRQLHMSPSHISRMVDRAEADALVARRADPDDRRATQIGLTATGAAVVKDFAPRLEAIIDRVITDNLSASETNTLIELLARIEAAANHKVP